MAQLALAFAGAYIGGSLFGTALAARIGWAIGSYLGARLFAPDLPDVEGPRLSDLQVTSGADYGTPITRVWGTVRVSCPLIWAAPIKERAYTTEVGGGKGGGGTQKITTYKYFADFAVYVCEGPIDSINRIWADGVVVYQAGISNNVEFALGDTFDQVNSSFGTFSAYLGTETQLPDALIESYEGIGNVSSNRGICYLVFKDFALEKFGNRIPNIRVEVVAGTGKGSTESLRLRTSSIASAVDDAKIAAYSNKFDRIIVADRKIGSTSSKTIPRIHFFDTNSNQIFYLDITTERDNIGFFCMSINKNNENSLVILYWDLLSGGTLYTVTIDLKTYLISKKRLTGYSNQKVQGTFYDASTGIYYHPFYNNDTSAGNVDTHGVFTSAGSVLYEEDGQTNPSYFNLSGIFSSDIYTANVVNGYLYVISKSTIYKMTTNGKVVASFPRPVGGISETVTLSRDQFAYDTTENIIYMQADNSGQIEIEAFDCNNEAFLDTSWMNSFLPSGLPARSTLSVDPDSGILFLTVLKPLEYNYTVYAINTKSKSLVVKIDSLPDASSSSSYFFLTSSIRNGKEFFVWHSNQDFITLSNVGTIPLSSILDSIEERLLPASSYDNIGVSSQLVNGAFVSKPVEASKFIELLSSVFFFDVVEVDGQLKSIFRYGNTPLYSFYETDFLDDLSTTISSNFELPTRVSIIYLDKDNDYQQVEQHIDKKTQRFTDRRNYISIDVPIVFSANEAVALVNTAFSESTSMSSRVSFTLPYKFLDLSPSDLVTITYANAQHDVLIRKITLDAGRIVCDGTIYNKNDYSPISVYPTVSYKTYVIEDPVASNLFLMDTARLDDTDDSSGFMVAASPVYDGFWTAAYLFSSTDNVNYSLISSIPQKATYGVLTKDLVFDGNTTTWSDASITIVPIVGTFLSALEIDVLNGENLIFINGELIQFVNAASNADGSITLSKLLRARKGTEWAATTHKAGSFVILLKEDYVSWIDQDVSAIGDYKYYRAVTENTSLDDADAYKFAYSGNDIKPLSPVHVKIKELGSIYDLRLSWERRTRIGGEWKDYIDAPLGEDYEEYTIEEVDPYGTVVNSAITTSKSASITVSSLDNSLYIYQNSARAGKGFPAGPFLPIADEGFSYHVIKSNPLAYFRLNEESPSVVSSTNGYTGTVSGGYKLRQQPTFGEGISSIKLGYVPSGSISTNVPAITGTSGRSFLFWVRWVDSYTVLLQFSNMIFEISANYSYYRLRIAQSSSHALGTYNLGPIKNTNQFLAVVIPDNSYISSSRFFVNGDLDPVASVAFDALVNTPSGADFVIGGAGNCYYDEVVIYDRALSDDEVKKLYKVSQRTAL